MKQNFIKTTDAETATKLLSLGFKQLSYDGNVYTFLNEPLKNINFTEVDKKKYVYTNTLCV